MAQWVSKFYVLVTGFLGPRSRAGHDDASERLHRSWATVAEFGNSRPSRSGRGLPRSSIRRRVGSHPVHIPKNRVKCGEILSGTYARSTRSALRSCNAIFNSLDEYVGHGGAFNRRRPPSISLSYLRPYLFSLPTLLLYSSHPHSPLRHPHQLSAPCCSNLDYLLGARLHATNIKSPRTGINLS